MRDSGVEWIGEVPREWQIDRLKDKTTLVVGGDWGDDPESDATGENVIVLRVADIQDRYFRFDNLTIRKIKPSSLISRLVNERSILIEKSGGGEKQLVGRAALPKGFSANAICSNFMAKIDFDYSVDVEYVNFLFSSLYFQNLNYPYIQQTTGIQNLNVTYYLASKVLFPPRKEQKAIAHYLDQRCGKLDAIIAIKQQQIKTLDALRQSIIYQAVTKGLEASVPLVDSGVKWLGKIPKNWQIKRVKDVLDFYNTKRIPLSSADRGEMEIKEYDYYGASGIIDKVEGYIFDGTYILVAEDGANLLSRNTPLAFIATGKFWVNNHAHILKPRFGDITYFTNLLESMDFSLFVTGAAQPKLTKENLGNFKILNPPLSEQELIAEHIEKETQRLDQLKINLNQQISTLEAYKKSLIYECVTGKKRVALDHPSDEIALA